MAHGNAKPLPQGNAEADITKPLPTLSFWEILFSFANFIGYK
jgi:hypothetical protein